jgi:hypothetical protein
MRPDVIAQVYHEAESTPRPEAVTVLVASRDEETIRALAPRVARRLYPDMELGQVLWSEPCPPPSYDCEGHYEWSEAAVRVGRDAPR